MPTEPSDSMRTPLLSKDQESHNVNISPEPFSQQTKTDDGTTPPTDVDKPEMEPGTFSHCGMALLTIPIFMGYACLNSMQHNIKTKLNIPDDNSPASHNFGVAVSFLYLGNLVFRLMHNFIFTFLTPRQRVILSYVCIILSMNMLGWLIFVVEVTDLSVVFVGYALGGVGIGTFESNLISVITPYGHRAKSWAVIGIPLGYNAVSVGGFFLLAADGSEGMTFAQYMIVFVACVGGLSYFVLRVEDMPFESARDNVSLFYQKAKEYPQWLPHIWLYTLALMLDMFCVALFSSLSLYLFDMDQIPLWTNGPKVPKNYFYAVYNLCSFLGDTTSRKLAYSDRARHPMLFVIFSGIGAALVLSKIAILGPLGVLCIFFANGSIYAHTTRRIDQSVAHRYNLIALSVWLFVGDIGSFTGSNLVSYIKIWVGTVSS